MDRQKKSEVLFGKPISPRKHINDEKFTYLVDYFEELYKKEQLDSYRV